MLCEQAQKALGDSLAARAEVPREVRTHAGSCPACQAVFERELALFAALEVGLRSRANAGVSVDFLPNVRARIAEAPASRRLFFPGWTAAVSLAAVVLIIGFVLRVSRSFHGKDTDARSHVARSAASTTALPGNPPTVARTESTSHGMQRRLRSIPEGASPTPAPGAKVLVPQEERVALALLVKNLTRRNSAPNGTLVVSFALDVDSQSISDLEISPLEVKPLASEPPESGDGER